MCCNINYKQMNNAALLSLNSTVVAGVSYIAGRAIGILNGASFGLIQSVVSEIILRNVKAENRTNVYRAAALTIGGITAFGVSHAAAAIGLIAAPISVPSALVLTVASFGFQYFVKPYALKLETYCYQRMLQKKEPDINQDPKTKATNI